MSGPEILVRGPRGLMMRVEDWVEGVKECTCCSDGCDCGCICSCATHRSACACGLADTTCPFGVEADGTDQPRTTHE